MKCLRCGKSFINSVPTITNSGTLAVKDIMTKKWCADCNQFCSNILFRESSAYMLPRNKIQDPMKRM